VRDLLRRPGIRALLGTLLGSLPAFALPFAVAQHFGVGRDTDAYVYGLAIATFGLTMAYSVLEANVLVVARASSRKGRDEFLRFVRRTARQAFLVVSLAELPVAAIGLIVLASRHSWGVGERHLSMIVIVILLGVVATAGVTSVLAGCLYAVGDFFVPTLTKSLRAVVPLVGLLFLGTGGGAIEQLAVMVVAGEVLRALILAVRLRKCSRHMTAQPPGRQLLGVWRSAAPAALGIATIGLNPIIDRSIAAHFGAGSVTVLDLGEKIFYVPFTVVEASIVLVAGARWAHSVAGDRSLLRTDFFRSLKITVGLSALLAVATIGALFILCAVLGRDIGGVPTYRMRDVSVFFLIGLPGATTWLLCGRLLSVTQQTHLLPLFAIVGLAINFLGDLGGSALIQVDGIALGSSLVSYATAALGIFTCRRLLDYDFPRNPFRSHVKLISAAVDR
jgi:peptidoglycan biosynthesis protein MviN/MurJ (putative lipid II flippase)